MTTTGEANTADRLTPGVSGERPKPSTPAAPGEEHLSVWFWPALVVGWAAIWFGFHSVNRAGIDPYNLAKFTVGGLVAHDGIWAPAVVAVGLVTARWLPMWLRASVRIALALSAVLFLTTRPVTGRYGATPANRSIDPGNAGRFLVIVIVLVWGTCIGLALWRRRRTVTAGRSDPEKEPA